MKKIPQDLFPLLSSYTGPKGTLSLAATGKKARETQHRLELSKKEILKALLYTTCGVLDGKVGGERWLLRFPSPHSNSVVAVIFNFHYLGVSKKGITVQLVGENIGSGKHYNYHDVAVDKNLSFNFTFPRTMKDQVYTFLHGVIYKYYDRLEKTDRYATSNFMHVYHDKHLLPKVQEECKIVKISENPVFDHMKSCLSLLMNIYYQ
jgi:hypothetical protein